MSKKITLLFPAILLFGIGALKAQYHNLFDFNNRELPASSVTVSGGKLYGLVPFGGSSNLGYMYSMDADGSHFKNLWNFDDTGVNGHANGASPQGALTLVGNKFFSMTYQGGSKLMGNIFSINMDGSGYSDLWDFYDTGSAGNANGEQPYGNLTYFGNKFYGMTNLGGANGMGVIFSIDTNGKHYRDLLDFNNTNGEYPYGSLTLSASGAVLYGMASSGGAHGDGIVFSIDTDGTHFKDLLDFNNTNGSTPYASLTLSGTQLFGITNSGGGYGRGSVFSIATDGSFFKPLVDFNGLNGAENSLGGSLTLFGKTLYATTPNGGPSSSGGIIFSIDTDGTAMTDLFDFNNNTGVNSYASLTLSGDTLYGTTSTGGAFNFGVVFSYIDTNIGLGVNTLHANAAGGLNLYPNPSGGIVTVQLGAVSMTNDDIQVFNSLGKEVYPSYQPGDHFTVDFSNEPNGVYFLRIISNKGYLVGQGKLILQK